MTGPAPAGAPDAAGPAVFATLDLGSATTAAALVGRAGGRWRLLAAAALPAGADPDALVALLRDRVRAADPGLAGALGLAEAATAGDVTAADAASSSAASTARPPDRAAAIDRLVARTMRPPTMLLVAATERGREELEAVAATAGWLTAGASAERHDPVAIVRLATRAGIDGLLVGTADPPGADERGLVEELAGVAGAVAARRPGIPVVLAGAVGRVAPALARRDGEVAAVPDAVLAPAAAGGNPADSELRQLLDDLRPGADDGRRALARAAGSLARVLGRRVEVVDVGASGASRILASPDPAAAGGVRLARVDVPAGALLALDAGDAIDRVDAWSAVALDRARLRDRLAEMRLAPWSDLAGDGAPLRAAALRAALERLAAASDPLLGETTPDLLVATGAFGALPAPAVALVLADVLRRPGATQLALDAARLLAPLGTIVDDAARDAWIADLAEDLLVPLGTVVIARDARPGRPAGRVAVDADGAAGEIDLEAGALALVDLPPGQQGLADLRFRSTVDLGTRGRHFVVPVVGGLAGLLVDLRDLPDGLPGRPDRRRELLAGWERALWPERGE